LAAIDQYMNQVLEISTCDVTYMNVLEQILELVMCVFQEIHR